MIDSLKFFFRKYKNIFLYLISVLTGAFLVFGFYYIKNEKQNTERIEKNKEEQKIALKKENIKKYNINLKKEISKKLFLSSDSYLVANLDTSEKYFFKNQNKKKAIASITKILTSIVALENFLPDSKIKILKPYLATEGDNGLIVGEVFSLKELIPFMMMVSSNDASFAISNSYQNKRDAFLKMMNLTANKIGMKSSIFFSESGLDLKKENIGGSYSTVDDIFLLVKYFYKKYSDLSSKFSKERGKFCSNNLCHQTYNTNDLFSQNEIKTIETKKYPYNINKKEVIKIEKKSNFKYPILFSKTGFTNISGHSLALITKIEGQRIVVIVLGSKKNLRSDDVRKLAFSVEKYLKSKK